MKPRSPRDAAIEPTGKYSRRRLNGYKPSGFLTTDQKSKARSQKPKTKSPKTQNRKIAIALKLSYDRLFKIHKKQTSKKTSYREVGGFLKPAVLEAVGLSPTLASFSASAMVSASSPGLGEAYLAETFSLPCSRP